MKTWTCELYLGHFHITTLAVRSSLAPEFVSLAVYKKMASIAVATENPEDFARPLSYRVAVFQQEEPCGYMASKYNLYSFEKGEE